MVTPLSLRRTRQADSRGEHRYTYQQPADNDSRLPLRHPIEYKNTLRSYNIPELSPNRANFNALNVEGIAKDKAEVLTLRE